MHTDDLGVKPYVSGSVLWEAIETAFFGTGPLHKRIDLCYHAYIEWCQRAGVDCRCERFDRAYFCKHKTSNPPKLIHKAMEGRQLLPFVYLVATAMNDGSDHRVLMEACVHALLQKQLLEDEAEDLFEEEALQRYQCSVQDFLELYDGLAEEAADSGSPSWHRVPKHHYAQHIAEFFAPLENPHRVACWRGEGLMLFLRKAGPFCSPRCFAKAFLVKARVSLAKRWQSFLDGV
jgi:hypothetical protein